MFLSELRISFLEHLSIKNYSQSSINGYGSILRRWIEFNGDVDSSAINAESLNRLRIDWLKRGIKHRTINHALSTIRSLATFLEKKGVSFINPRLIELGINEQKKIDLPTHEEVRRLEAVIVNPRDRAIVKLLIVSGIRVSELTSLNRADINFESYQFYILGKGRKVRMCFFTPDMAQLLKSYMESRTDNFPALFVSESTNYSSDGRISRVSVEALVRKYAIVARISKKLTPHTLRHYFATSLLEKGCDIRIVQELLGHTSIATTQIYTHLTKVHLQNSYRQLMILKN